MFFVFRILILGVVLYLCYRAATYIRDEVLSDTKTCPRCEGKGWWQNTRNRDKCEWCQGSGRIPKDMPV